MRFASLRQLKSDLDRLSVAPSGGYAPQVCRGGPLLGFLKADAVCSYKQATIGNNAGRAQDRPKGLCLRRTWRDESI